MADSRYINVRDLAARLNVSPATLWRWVRSGNFPAPSKLGPNCTRWRLSDVHSWERAKAEAAA